jgi:hypothetical protein
MLLPSPLMFASLLLLTLLLLLASMRLLLDRVYGMSAIVGVPYAANTSAVAGVTLLLLSVMFLVSAVPGVPLIAIALLPFLLLLLLRDVPCIMSALATVVADAAKTHAFETTPVVASVSVALLLPAPLLLLLVRDVHPTSAVNVVHAVVDISAVDGVASVVSVLTVIGSMPF